MRGWLSARSPPDEAEAEALLRGGKPDASRTTIALDICADPHRQAHQCRRRACKVVGTSPCGWDWTRAFRRAKVSKESPKRPLQSCVKECDAGVDEGLHSPPPHDFACSRSGIPPGDLLHIFDRFYRVDRSRNSASGGTGLGVAIVKRIVELRQSSISVSSEIGVGTSFRVDLPIAKGFARPPV
ncbi:MAG TPA: sensor histidine kinase [Acetobacteraceae bacterium]|nr:sensor histidine kinase [Acetobacteraceae bacterium]